MTTRRGGGRPPPAPGRSGSAPHPEPLPPCGTMSILNQCKTLDGVAGDRAVWACCIRTACIRAELLNNRCPGQPVGSAPDQTRAALTRPCIPADTAVQPGVSWHAAASLGVAPSFKHGRHRPPSRHQCMQPETGGTLMSLSSRQLPAAPATAAAMARFGNASPSA